VSRPVARAAEAVVIALAIAGTAVGAGYGLQRAALREPPRSERLAARIEGRLLQFRYVRSTIHIPGEPPRRAECLEGWLPRKDGRPAGRGAKILFADGEKLLLGDRKAVRLAPAPRPVLIPPIAEVQLAGCGRALTNHIYGRLVGIRRIAARKATFLGKPARSLGVHTRRTRFWLYADLKTLFPVGLRVEARGTTAWSRVRQVKLTPELRQDFNRKFDG
jgi:hypothetical protein